MNFPKSITPFSVACIFFVCSLSSLVRVQARQFDVGGRDGWVVHPAEDYSHWAGRNRFLINDTLLFKYKKGENSVLLVNKDGYDKCDTHNPIKKWDDGDTVFQFDRSGPFHFISGQAGNCQNGQKLAVVVLTFRPRPLPLPPPKALPPRSSSPTPATAPGTAPPGSSTPATSPAPSISPATTPTHAPAMGPSSLSPSPTSAPGSSTPATSPSPSTSPATTPTHAPAMGPSSLSPSPTAGSPSSAPTATAPSSGPTAPGAPAASPPVPSTTPPSPGGSAQSSPPSGTPTGVPANVTSPPPSQSAAQVVNPLRIWSLAVLITALGQI